MENTLESVKVDYFLRTRQTYRWITTKLQTVGMRKYQDTLNAC